MLNGFKAFDLLGTFFPNYDWRRGDYDFIIKRNELSSLAL